MFQYWCNVLLVVYRMSCNECCVTCNVCVLYVYLCMFIFYNSSMLYFVYVYGCLYIYGMYVWCMYIFFHLHSLRMYLHVRIMHAYTTYYVLFAHIISWIISSLYLPLSVNIVLYCIVFSCAVLCCIVVYCVVLYCCMYECNMRMFVCSNAEMWMDWYMNLG